MKQRTLTRPRTRLLPGAQPLTVTAYVHRSTQSAWLDVVGDVSSPASLKVLLAQLRRVHRRLPRGIDVVGVDLTRLDVITMDLAVLLCLESRMLRVRNIELAIALRKETEAPQGGEEMLERLQIWRVDDDRLADVSRAADEARLGEHGWQLLAERQDTATIAARPR